MFRRFFFQTRSDLSFVSSGVTISVFQCNHQCNDSFDQGNITRPWKLRLQHKVPKRCIWYSTSMIAVITERMKIWWKRGKKGFSPCHRASPETQRFLGMHDKADGRSQFISIIATIYMYDIFMGAPWIADAAPRGSAWRGAARGEAARWPLAIATTPHTSFIHQNQFRLTFSSALFSSQ